jgi:thioredoxin-like negative regulator of GroEL
MITWLPTVVVFKDGEEVDRLRGLQPPEAYSALLDKRVSTD